MYASGMSRPLRKKLACPSMMGAAARITSSSTRSSSSSFESLRPSAPCFIEQWSFTTNGVLPGSRQPGEMCCGSRRRKAPGHPPAACIPRRHFTLVAPTAMSSSRASKGRGDSLSSILFACETKEWDEAMREIRALDGQGRLLSVEGAEAILQSCRQGDPDQQEAAYQMALTLLRSRCCPRDRRLFAAVVDVCCASVRDSSEAEGLLEGLQSVALSWEQCEAGLSMCRLAGGAGKETALALASHMAKAGMLPDVNALGRLVKSCAAKGPHDVAWELLRRGVSGEGRMPAIDAETLEGRVLDLSASVLSPSSTRGGRGMPVVTSMASINHLLSSMEATGVSFPSTKAWAAMVKLACAQQAYSDALHIVARMQEAGLQPDDEIGLPLLQGCESTVGLAQRALSVCLASKGSSLEVPRLALEAARRSRSARPAAMQLIDTRLHEGRLIEPDLHLCTLIIETCVDLRNIKYCAAMMKSLESVRCPPLTEVCTEVVERAAAKGRSDDCLWLLRQMTYNGVPRSLEVYSATIAATSMSPTPTTGLDLLNEMELQDSIAPDRECFERFMRGASRQGWVRDSLQALTAMKSKGLGAPLDKAIYSNLLLTCANKGAWEDAASIIKTMRDAGLFPTHPMMHMALQACASHNAWDMALLLFMSMKTLGPKPIAATYTVVMKACGKAGKVEEAVHLFKEMQALGLNADMFTYLVMMDTFGKAGRAVEAEECFKTMRGKGMQPRVAHYTALIDACGRGGEAKRALYWLAKMEERGVRANVATFTAAIYACRLGGMWEEACKLCFYNPTYQHVSPMPFFMLIDTCARNGAWPVAFYLYDMRRALTGESGDVWSGFDKRAAESTQNELKYLVNAVDETAVELFALACYRQDYERGYVTHWSFTSPGMMDLHNYSRPLASVAIRYVFEEMATGGEGGSRRSDEDDDKRVAAKSHVHRPKNDLIIVTGRGRHNQTGEATLRNFVKEYLTETLGLEVVPYMRGVAAETILGLNPGRLVVTSESLQAWVRTRRLDKFRVGRKEVRALNQSGRT